MEVPKSNIEQVKEFHETFGHPIADVPGVLTHKRGLDRVGYIKSETDELEDAIMATDLVETADALLDIEYFVNGTWVEIGLAPIKDILFAEVHRSNMSKSCANMEEVRATIQFYKDKNIVGYYKEINGRYICYNSVTDKVLKSINYQEPNLKKIIDDYKSNLNK